MATVIGQRVPPLAAGDKLTREEFLRRWEAHPQINNAELLGGIVYMSSPVSVEHGDSDGRVGGWLQYYSAFTPGTASGHNTTGLWLDGKALLAGNMAEALLKLQQGLRSPEHQTFVAELGRRKE
ncbi:MAG TPA: hypothetical protein VMV69_23380 [Pirellulales bacterium]|nr:hypothetical protein [Pirellulales bacterium]